MVPNLRLPGERLAADAADVRLVPGVHDGVHLEVVRVPEGLAAEVAHVLLDAGVRALVLRQVLLRQERLGAVRALERPRPHLVRLLVRLVCVLAGEVLAAHLAHVRPQACVRVDVLFQ